jgi:hypothetical protein
MQFFKKSKKIINEQQLYDETELLKQMNGREIFKNLSKFSRGQFLKINKKKSFSSSHKRLRPNIHHIVVVQ